MTKFAVVKAGGKQYLVKENDEIIVDKIEAKEKDKLELEKLAEFNDEQVNLQLGTPLLKDKVNVQVITQLKGDKIRVAKFKAKVRYRRVRGFRARLTKIKITKI
ncbi:50S ribosomal protein L21 [Candidatus Roizmanbacteria bacterium RIFCSPHIGHO2_02_FULL_37_15]|uniref:Large ribosomal subunit protein bL21 n=1 Tax=Candidatus Roizmanbacteria bacterium RIFCSPLOWO2_01_FULL_37_16 TaxID=1802058 RepID=A0A1F7IIU8_9BACT|nr:MAG: 50S ribosomal protein L21 [Candidatus Roizmanbacteria bacterium RIFCSPHIGHO2_01_FULL_37_16b]OGK20432.1 MAG: 50S ribosomal protein L21 [Candidatus Roizmanbacteria bacterium RIFCSPHIGHO2_02_FULL_37_15]OGK34033.1 MAG: 50S ribosomal protein L21 [Candidatus Roizmanbacteria bacterium RIFCSPHIGHO2_12_FULL_36_11]OGK43283.1 MAG: 50S ribosomal protein L21 [Candidatus Roizmanbacteria bacterium RIFCSPLOWO2_01_FULL_37_16]